MGGLGDQRSFQDLVWITASGWRWSPQGFDQSRKRRASSVNPTGQSVSFALEIRFDHPDNSGGTEMSKSIERGPEKDPREKTCPECGGSGRKNGEKCNRCDGKGWILTQK